MKTLILGGIRSGKSRLAESLAVKSGLPVTCIVTATAGDGEMRERIAAHRLRRPPAWRVIEEPRALAGVLRAEARDDRCLLVDCLTLWLTNLVCAPERGRLDAEREALLALLPTLPGEIILVGNETGLGVVPMGEISRRFCDEAGRLHQDLARLCDRVIFTVAGLPQLLKGRPL